MVVTVTVSIIELMGQTYGRCGRHPELLAVPFVASFLQVGRLGSLFGRAGDRGFSVTFPFPGPLVDVWTFLSRSHGVPISELDATFLALIPVAVVVEAALLAVYVGSLDEVLRTGDYDGVANLRAYFVPFLWYNVLIALVSVGFLGGAVTLFGSGAGVGAFALVFALLVLVGGYLFYAAPFLVVVEDRGVVSAFQRSYALALDGGDYLWYCLQHAAVGAAVSIPMSFLVYNVSVPGFLVGAAVAAPIGLGLSGATLEFLRRHVGAGSDGRADGPPRPDRGHSGEAYDRVPGPSTGPDTECSR